MALQDSVLLIYPDELAYLDPARSFIQAGNFSIHNINLNWEPILYALFLAPFTLIENTYLQIKILKIFNCFLMCSSIFPVYLLSDKIVRGRKHVLLICFLTAIIPEFAMTQYFMAENLFFPLSVWLFYFIYLFECETCIWRKNAYVCVISLFCFFLYICKSIALSYAIGFVMVMAFEMFEKKRNLKRVIIQILLFSCIYILLLYIFKIYIVTTADVFGNLYDDMFQKLFIINIDEVIFAFYCMINYLVYTLVGFLYFPVVYTLIRINDLREENKKLFVFSSLSLLVMWSATILISNIHEDAMEDSIRIHMRYYSVLFIPFMILFFSAVAERRTLRNQQKRLFKVITALSSILMIMFLRIPKYGCDLDNFMLFYYKTGLYKLCDLLSSDIHKSGIILLSMLLIVLGIIVGTAFLISDKRFYKTFRVIICVLIIIFSFDNALITYFSFLNNNRFNIDVSDGVKINDYFNENEGNVLVVTNKYLSQDNTLDTYLNRLHYTSGYDQLYNNFVYNEGVWNIDKQKISANYPWHVYTDLDKIDYLVVRKDFEMNLDETYLEEIDIHGVSAYRVLKNKKPQQLSLDILVLEEEKIDIDFSDDGNSSLFIVSGFNGQEQDGNWTSKEAVLEFEAKIVSDFEIIVSGGRFIEYSNIEFVFDDIKIAEENINTTDYGYKIYIDDGQYNSESIRHSLRITDSEAISPALLSDEYRDTRVISFFVNEVIVQDIP